jgi:hypothetical protein
MKKTHKIDGIIVNEYVGTNIYEFENIFDTSLCNAIISIIDKAPLKRSVFRKGSNVQCYTLTLEEMIHRSSKYHYVFPKKPTYELIIQNRIPEVPKQLLHECMEDINEQMRKVKRTITSITNIHISSRTEYQLRKIHDYTRLHSDGIGHDHDDPVIRSASVIVALNDDYDDGIVHFPKHDLHIRLKRGTVLLFPPFWTHPHQVSSPGKDQYRYTIQTWFLEKGFIELE